MGMISDGEHATAVGAAVAHRGSPCLRNRWLPGPTPTWSNLRVHPARALAAPARRRVGQPTNLRHQPRGPPACATGRRVALADPAGLAPGRVVHAPVGGQGVVPWQL